MAKSQGRQVLCETFSRYSEVVQKDAGHTAEPFSLERRMRKDAPYISLGTNFSIPRFSQLSDDLQGFVSERHIDHWVPETDLLARTKNNDPTVTAVLMWQTKTVQVPPTMHADVFTFGLCGCTAVAVVSKLGDGTRSVTLSHYPPVSLATQLAELRRALPTSAHATGGAMGQHAVFIITPGEWSKDDAGKWFTHAKEPELVARINGAIQEYLPGVQPKVLSYSEVLCRGRSLAFVVRVPDDDSKAIRYEGVSYGVCEF